MRFKLFILPATLLFHIAGAQNGSSTVITSQRTGTLAPITSSTAVTPQGSTLSTESELGQVLITDYKNVYEAATLEEEVKMAAERFKLTPSQQEVWSKAATDRRVTEKQFREKFNSKDPNYSRDAAYRGLRTAHNTFYGIIIGYLNPTQKQSMETDREILHEKQSRLAQLPPPTPTITVVPVDSAAIKASEKAKAADKKKKKKPVGA